jgi:alkylation response protein AidB-like acyl-CoA dehydrogenase
MAKLKASRLATWAASEAVQIHGGLGYMLESPVAPSTATRRCSRSAKAPTRSAPRDRALGC